MTLQNAPRPKNIGILQRRCAKWRMPMVPGNRARSHIVATAIAVIVFGWAASGSRVEARQAGSASIVGQVTDESKSVLPGVTVKATSPALLVPSIEAVTDANGEYRLTRLPLGTYTVEY